MRKVIFQEWVSMDGCAADAKGSVSFLESYTLNKYSDIDLLAWLEENIDTILLGAHTYRLFVDFWPGCTSDQEIIADKLNSLPKIVFSRTITSAPWGKWPDATLVASDAAEEVKRLKKKDGKDLVLWGSISLAQDLMRHNLIDEYHLRICPLVLGGGRPLFESVGRLPFELYESKQYDSGLMLLQYRRQS